ncbi:TPA: hypothetical protein R4234_004695 [Klebsiella pneumoniae]|nr:hypothetical protein [Klebsiella pneumoniae]
MTSKLTRERLLEIAEDGFLKHGESKELARMALAAMNGEPFAYIIQDKYERERGVEGHLSRSHVSKYVSQEDINEHEITCTPLYRHAQPAPVVQKTAHSSVIAEQLANVLSGIEFTDHQRAVISCAVDRLNNVAQLLQLSPSALLVPEILDYQGAKELYNYLMTEEEINATVNAWNACRAAMLSGGKS